MGIAVGGFTLFTLLMGAGQLAQSMMQLEPTSLVVRADGKSLVLSGDLYYGAEAALAKALDSAPTVTTVVLRSRGGDVGTGNWLAGVIAARHLSTSVEEECLSACTIAFLAGKERSAESRARIGFHSFKGAIPGWTERELAEYVYGQAGLSTSFIARVVDTPSDSMWYPSHDELLAEGVLTTSSLQAAHRGSEGPETPNKPWSK